MSDAPLFQVRDLHVSADETQILSGIDLTVGAGEVHAIMGPNGSGKSTLANALLGSPEYEVTSGAVLLKGDDVTDWEPDVRAKQGMFLAFQYPQEIPGVTVNNFLQQAVSARRGEDQSVLETRRRIMGWMQRLDMDAKFAERFLNEGFSGGEKKRAEVLQMAMLEPDIAILDETDSGLDVDALKVVSEGVNRAKEEIGLGVLLITHYTRILRYIEPDFVHVFVAGKVAEQGGPELAERLEAEGYDRYLKTEA